MGWNNPPIPWSELERTLSGRRPAGVRPRRRRRQPGLVPPAAQTTSRPPAPPPAEDRVPYAELHCHSNFSFLDGASHPEELAEEAARLGLDALALTDHDGFYGVVRFAEAAKALGVRTIFGAELSLGLHRAAERLADPEGSHLLVLARDPEGYGRLCRARSAPPSWRRREGPPVYDARPSWPAPHDGHWLVLTGCRKGAVPARAGRGDGPAGRGPRARRAGRPFGRDNVAVELWHHGDPLDSARNDALAELAAARGLVDRRHQQRALRGARPAPAGHRAGRGPGPAQPRRDGRLAARRRHAHLRSGAEMAARFARFPGAVQRAAELGAGLLVRPAPGGPAAARLSSYEN